MVDDEWLPVFVESASISIYVAQFHLYRWWLPPNGFIDSLNFRTQLGPWTAQAYDMQCQRCASESPAELVKNKGSWLPFWNTALVGLGRMGTGYQYI